MTSFIGLAGTGGTPEPSWAVQIGVAARLNGAVVVKDRHEGAVTLLAEWGDPILIEQMCTTSSR